MSLSTVALLAILLVIALLLRSLGTRPQRIFIAASIAGLLWGGIVLVHDAYRASVDRSWLEGRQQIQAEIAKVEDSSSYLRLRLTNIQRDDGKNLAGDTELYLYGEARRLPLSAGQLITASAKFHQPRNRHNPGAFDYRGYCFDRHIALIGSGKNVVIIDSQLPLLEEARIRIRSSLSGADTTGLIRALLLAERSGISADVQDLFAAAGVAHLLAISGLHVGMVAGWVFVIIWWLLTRREAWIVRLPVRKLALSGGLLAAAAYAALAGWPVTAERSVLMMAAAVLAWWLRSRAEPVNTMLAALMLLLLSDPGAIVSISLWLSFIAVTALLLWAGGTAQKRDRDWLSSIGHWVSGLLWVSVVATLATLPIITDLFGRLPTYSLIANMILVPLYTVAVLPLALLGELSAIAGATSFADLLFSWSTAVIDQGNAILTEIYSWPAGRLWIPDVPLVVGLLYGAGMACSMALLLRKKYVAMLASAAVTLAIYLLLVIPESYPENPTLVVWDVGQGAATTLTMPDGRVMAIDLPGRHGSRYNGGTDVAAGLREMGEVHADLLVLSHAQYDHAGGAERFLQQLRSVSELWLADVPANRNYPPMQAAVREVARRGGSVRWLKQGDRLSFGDAGVRVLWPPQGYSPENSNNTSLVLSVDFPSGKRMLFSGDIERAVETEIVKTGLAQHDLLLVPHHGSRTSSSAAWIEKASPEIAIAQTGWANRYGFPADDVVARYRQSGAALFDSKYGAVTVVFDAVAESGMQTDQYRPEIIGKRETALQWWQRTL